MMNEKDFRVSMAIAEQFEWATSCLWSGRSWKTEDSGGNLPAARVDHRLSIIGGQKIFTDIRETETGKDNLSFNEGVEKWPEELWQRAQGELRELHWDRCEVARAKGVKND